MVTRIASGMPLSPLPLIVRAGVFLSRRFGGVFGVIFWRPGARDDSRCTCFGGFAKPSSSYGVSREVLGTSVSSAIFSMRALALEATGRPPRPSTASLVKRFKSPFCQVSAGQCFDLSSFDTLLAFAIR